MDNNGAQYNVGNTIQVDSKPCLKQIQINGVELTVELDCGEMAFLNWIIIP